MTVADEPAPPLTISLFGPFCLQVNGALLPRLGAWRQQEAILALLLLHHPHPLERSWLAGWLWPECTESQGLATLRRYLTDLRRALGPAAVRLQSPSASSLALDLTGAAIDLLVFDAALARGDPPSLEAAVALYQGPLLEGWMAEWVFQERQVREQGFLRALEALAEGAMARGDPATAEGYLRRAVGVDPLRESAQRALMQTLAAGGNYAEAILTYRELRLGLQRELNLEPDAETRALFQHLRAEARRRAASGGHCYAGRLPETGEEKPALLSLETNNFGCQGAPESATERDPGTRDELDALAEEDLPRIEVGTPITTSRLRLPQAPEHNLPVPLTRFIGREREMAEVKRLLATTHLLTLTGAGGCGKSRLALQAAAGVLEEFPDGVWLVELASLADPRLVPQAVAAVLGLREQTGRSVTETLLDALRPRFLLLLLDNCEHLLTTAAELNNPAGNMLQYGHS